MSGEMRNSEGKSTAFLLRTFRSLLLLMQLLCRLCIQPGLRSALWLKGLRSALWLKCLFFCYFRPWTGMLWLGVWPRRWHRYSQSNAEQTQKKIHFCMSPSFLCYHVCTYSDTRPTDFTKSCLRHHRHGVDIYTLKGEMIWSWFQEVNSLSLPFQCSTLHHPIKR